MRRRSPMGAAVFPVFVLLASFLLAGCGEELGADSDGGTVALPADPVPTAAPPEVAAPVVPDPPVVSGAPVVPDAPVVQDAPAGAPAPSSPPSPRPDAVRGLYLNAWLSGSSRRMDEVLGIARRTEINSFVIDVKDATGYVSYPTAVPFAAEVGADGELRIRNVSRLLERLEEEGIHPIARIVVFKDHLLARSRPEHAIQDSTGAAWVDGNGEVWVNPYDRTVWAYNVALAREAVELGFREVQWDYVRFPDRPRSEMEGVVYPGQEGRTRSEAIREFLLWSREELADLDVPVTADVFGMATSARNDVGIGQLWEDMVDAVDVILPMIYPSHYWQGSFGIDAPNAHPYEVIGSALRHAIRRTEGVENPARIVPWLQDFTLGQPRYEAPEVRAQILATRDAGIHEWILWNASGRYTEAALEPVGGWPGGVEPVIRLGGLIAPAEDRFAGSESAELDQAAGAPLDPR
ncbi:MAG: hypothetical protein EA422_03810 [Gemmatimonadales bacterium]|nr:MAG: hypothetical protein EA422_03810 [Gemmatimonadales bacterium]